jgi:hypothetical protein
VIWSSKSPTNVEVKNQDIATGHGQHMKKQVTPDFEPVVTGEERKQTTFNKQNGLFFGVDLHASVFNL